jgi:hypothetical protein
MSLDEFFEELKRTPRSWRILATGAIRMGCDCPITAVCAAVKWKEYDTDRYVAAAQGLGLDLRLANQIQKAADYDEKLLGSWPADRPLVELRGRLLEACGLTGGKV